MPIRFRIRWIPFIATILVATIGVSLGQWQTRRGDEKEVLQARLAARQCAPVLMLNDTVQLDVAQVEFRRVKLRGRFLPDWVMYLENRPYHGVSGFYVLMPFTISGSPSTVMIERGWSPRDAADRARVPVVPTPTGEIEVEGIIRRDAGHLLQLGAAEAPRQGGVILQNLDLDAFAEASSLLLVPFVIEQSGNVPDGLIRDWPMPSSGIERHRGYAVQWYALALMAVIFFVVTGYRSGKKQTAR